MRATPLLVVVAAAALPAPPAAAAGGVYGGTTAAGEAIVFKTDRAGERVRSAVVAVVASCGDGDDYSISARVAATRRAPGFEPGPRDLAMTRNRRGRFAGTVAMVHSLGGEHSGVVRIEVRGRLRRTSASGTLAGRADVYDDTGERVTTCTTGRVRWTASRAAGRIYGGATSQGEPFVARLDARRRRVDAVYLGWRSQECSPGGGVRLGEGFGNFRLDRDGHWGGSWNRGVPLDGGRRAAFSYALHGAFRGSSARGTLAVGLERFDAAGVADLSCRTGTIRWSASTG